MRFVAFGGSPEPSHAADITDTFELGVRSLECHRAYLEGLGGDMGSPDTFLREAAVAGGEQLGVALATTFELVT